MSNKTKSVFCPHCKASYKAKHLSGIKKEDFIKLLLIMIPSTVLGSGVFGGKFILVIVPILIIFEYAYRMNARLSIVCPHCGFDVLLYKKNVVQMRDRIIGIRENKEKKLRDMIAMGLE